MEAVVIGAGIGGLTAALALARAGLRVRVFEQAPALREVGAGIQLAPNATRILHRLGLADALARVAVKPARSELRRWDDGRVLWSQPLGAVIEERFGAPYYHLYRPDLLGVLADALPDGVLHLDRRVTAITERDDGVLVRLGDGSTTRADVALGADGIHSTVRAALFGPESPRFSGSTAYRGLVPVERLAHLDLPRQGYAWLGPDRHFVHYYVAGARLMNFVAVCPGGDWRIESWSARGRLADALAEFAGFHPTVREIIRAADETHRWALYDRAPLPRWSAGRVTLMGDAARDAPQAARHAGAAGLARECDDLPPAGRAGPGGARRAVRGPGAGGALRRAGLALRARRRGGDPVNRAASRAARRAALNATRRESEGRTRK